MLDFNVGTCCCSLCYVMLLNISSKIYTYVKLIGSKYTLKLLT